MRSEIATDTGTAALPLPTDTNAVTLPRSPFVPYSNQYCVELLFGVTFPVRLAVVRDIPFADSVFATGALPAGGGLLLVLKVYVVPFTVPYAFCAFRRKKYEVLACKPVMYPGEGIAFHPEPIACEDVLPPSVADCPYSYQYDVGAPLGVTLPVTTAVEFEGATPTSVTTLGALAEEVGFGVGVGLGVVLSVGDVEVATVPGAPEFAVRR